MALEPLHIACYGFVERDAGSVASAGLVILQRLLDLGHSVDFFGKKNFVYPTELSAWPNCRLFDVPNQRAEKLASRLATGGGRVRRFLASQLAHRCFARGVLQAMRSAHRDRPYDVQFWFGDWAWGRVGSAPVVSWVQGPPQTDARSVAQRRAEICQLAGWRDYLLFRAYAAYRGTLGLPTFSHTDHFIVGSQWARQRLAQYGIPPNRIDAIAYPIDLDRFRPGDDDAPRAQPPLVVWLGRTVPRKRLDLFLDACAALISAGSDLQVVVAGGFDFLPQYRKLIDRFAYPERLRYIERLNREDVIPLLRSAAVLVQPSEEENFGSAVAEAAACGTPVVLGPTNGTGDYVGAAAFRFDRYESGSVAQAIAQAIESRRPRAQISAEAREQLSPDRVADQLSAALRRAIRQANSPLDDHSQPLGEVPGNASTCRS